ncbi:MAG: PAS domain S-box-containing protein [Sulfurimonas sp.]|jgi:PAS domain S-box-containing protein
MGKVHTDIILLILCIALVIFWIIKLKRETIKRKKAECELKESEEKFRTLFDIAPVLLDAFDKNGKCTLWNKECEKVFGWTIEEVNSSNNTIELFYPDLKVQEEVMKSLSSPERHLFREWHPVTKEGVKIVTMWTNISLPNGDVINMGYNITEQRNAELEAQEKTEQLEETKNKLAQLNNSLEERVKIEVEKNKQHQKMMILQSRHAQMGEILSMIAHQWRHPLNNLSLIIQNSIFKYGVNKLDDDAISKLDIDSSTQIRQMSNTIKEFRSFFQPDNISVKYDINRSIVDALSIVKPMLEAENILLNIETQENILVVGFPTELGQAIVNIITNSKDALVERNVIKKSIKLSLVLIDNEVIITIEDNGGGVPLEIVDKIFDPYFSTKMEKHGTGLGLYMTKIIVEEHMHGKLNVSNSDNGLVVQIVVPHDKEQKKV